MSHDNKDCYCEMFQLPHVPEGTVVCTPCMDNGCSCREIDE